MSGGRDGQVGVDGDRGGGGTGKMEGWKLWMSLCRRRHAPGGQLPTLTQAHSLKFKEVKGKRRSPLRVNMIYKRKQATSKMTSHRIQAGGRVSCACCGVHVWVVGCRDNMPCQTLPLGATTWLPLATAYPSRNTTRTATKKSTRM